jgi:hypothetical protein
MVPLLSRLVIIEGDSPRDLTSLVVSGAGSLEATGDVFAPYRLVDSGGVVVSPVSAFFAELSACGRPASTQRSYGMDLLRWFRFLWTVETGWDQATRVEAKDFCRWLQIAEKPVRPHWRAPEATSTARSAAVRAPNAVTGKTPPGARYGAATVAHCESVLLGFYDFHVEARTGPMVNPFPLARGAGVHPGQAVQRCVRAIELTPRPGAGRILGVDRSPCGGVAWRHGRRCRPGPAVDHRGA